MESRYFSPEADEKLIYLVKENAALYNVRDNNYKDNIYKKTIWKSIATELGKNVTECKTRWRTIRDSYKKNKRKLESGFMPPRKSKYDRELLQFLDDSYTEKCNKEFFGNIIEELVEDENSNGAYIETKVISKCEFSDPNQTNSDDGMKDNTALSQRPNSKRPSKRPLPLDSSPDKIPPTVKKHRKTSDTKEPSELNYNLLQDGSDVRNHMTITAFDKFSEESEHPILTFFKSMAKTVMTFPPHLIAETRIKVCNVVTDIELRLLNDTTTETSQPS